VKQYSEELKTNIIAKMLSPNNVGVPELARETGIPKDTVRRHYSPVSRIRRLDLSTNLEEAPSGGA